MDRLVGFIADSALLKESFQFLTGMLASADCTRCRCEGGEGDTTTACLHS